MLLAIDVGNTSTSFGVFKGIKLVKRWVCKTTALKTLDLKQYRAYEVDIASVVHDADIVLKKKLPHAKFITAKGIKSLKITIHGDVGADRAVNAFAAKELYSCPAIVVDFGTATTFDVISKDGKYIGGAIVPGIRMAADALHENTSKLPRINILKPKKLIGNSTVEAMRSGVFYGYIALVEGMINRFKSEMKNPKSNLSVIATGGFAKFIGKYSQGIDIIDQDLTLKGISLLCQKN